ncbi:hypothetical protein LFL96_20385 [Paraburkholderia sp. D15]|uniref:hypothetical protein n=1 Tax=Paraburkholderia sp. D15 TaxID=2880218 RepID=UPI0024794B11|nr:hypothetical protein [Paraburkholderia sp. D15]WGS53426.1 hypothetical protein LFL96_20385 [Paraburkholderia sp. D15]
MHTCPVWRVAMKSRPVMSYCASRDREGVVKGRWLALLAGLLGVVGWFALRDLLNAIPDSNDDFGLF